MIPAIPLNFRRNAAGWAALLLVSLSTFEVATRAEAKRLTVLDYFLQLPSGNGTALEVKPKDLVTNLDAVDLQNGYLHVTGDGAQANIQVALFRYRDGRPLLAVYLEPDVTDPGATGWIFFYALGQNGKLTPVSESALPTRAEVEGVRSGFFKLPRQGNTIAVLDRHGRVQSRYAWTGTDFQLVGSGR